MKTGLLTLSAESVNQKSIRSLHENQAVGFLGGTKRKRPKAYLSFCAPSRDRTYDLRIKSPMLYQLSYRGIYVTDTIAHCVNNF